MENPSMFKPCLAVLLSVFCSSWLAAQTDTGSKASLHKEGAVRSGYANLPLSFESNSGQTDKNVKFLSRGPGYSLFLTGDEAVIELKKAVPQSSELKGLHVRQPGEAKKQTATKSAVLRMKLTGANAANRVMGEDELPGKVNYFIGNDPSKWRTNVATYAKVKYEAVYPGVDLVYYGNQGHLEYDFVVAPGADPKGIRLRLQGAGKLRVDEKGDLLIGKAGEEVRFEKPVVYQAIEGVRKPVEGSYVLAAANSFGFHVGEYNHSLPLVIDPVLAYSTYLGGDGNNSGSGIAVDASGNAYVTGFTSATNFPTANALQPNLKVNQVQFSDAFITKINASGTALIYSTYLGGSWDDSGAGIAVDASGNAYVTGSTSSNDFPTASALQSTNAGWINATQAGCQTGFVTKLNSSGSALIYSTYLGGTSCLDVPSSIAVDTSGTAYVTGATSSTDFPLAHALQSHNLNQATVFVTKLNASGSALIYSTYLGGHGPGTDAGNNIAADSAGNAYVTGASGSTDFPTVNAFQPTAGDTYNAFITKFNTDGSALAYSTYLGGSNYDSADGIAVDTAGNAYVTGVTQSTDFPTTTHALQSTMPNPSINTETAFVTKLNASGSGLIYSTYLGGTEGCSQPACETGYGIAVDTSGNAYVTGFTLSTDFPTTNAIQAANAGGFSDVFITKFNANGSALVYSTYLGGSQYDKGIGIALDSSGNAYVAGFTGSFNFPTTPNAFQRIFRGNNQVFVAKILSQTGNVPLTLVVSPATGGTTVPAPGTTSESLGSTVSISATPARGYGFVDWSPASAVAAANNPNTTVAMMQAETITANFAPLQTTIGGNITAKSGAANARVWTLSLTNNGPGVANGTTIHNFSLTQTFGAACTPGVSTAFPISLGNLQPGQAATTTVTLNFASCVATSRYTAKFTYLANGGTVSGTVARYNQYE
jgi:hypothetical protein